MNKYSALIIDLKKSRKYHQKERSEIQEYILKTVKSLNAILSKDIEKEVEFSAGDELQGLFSTCEAAYIFLRLFSMLVYPVKIRAGIGVGEWDVVLKDTGSTAQDGSAYHKARYSINKTNDLIGYSVLICSDTDKDFVINSLINSVMSIVQKNSIYQNELMLLVEYLYPIDIGKIIDKNEMHRIVELVNYRNKMDYYSKLRNSNKPYLFEMLIDYNSECKCLDALDADNFFVTIGKKRGLSTEISELVGVSRQSIEKSIKASNISEVRNHTGTLLKFMNSYWQEELD